MEGTIHLARCKDDKKVYGVLFTGLVDQARLFETIEDAFRSSFLYNPVLLPENRSLRLHIAFSSGQAFGVIAPIHHTLEQAINHTRTVFDRVCQITMGKITVEAPSLEIPGYSLFEESLF
ncbi:MAG: hypothetical protein H7A36_00080 [Chlamydiales bacterium]|nr:hypothetical protein [Chlamydiales bacterium]